MAEIYRNWQDDKNMILWNTFNSFRLVPPTETAYGKYPARLMISCGRALKQNLTKEDFDKLDVKIKEEIEDNFKKETGLNPEIDFFSKLKNIFVKAFYRSGKMLGFKCIGTEPADKHFEIYNYVKFTTWEEYRQFLNGVMLSAGALGKMNGMKSYQVLFEINDTAEKMIRRGYSMVI